MRVFYLSRRQSNHGKRKHGIGTPKFRNPMAKLVITAMTVLLIIGSMTTVTESQATCAQKLVSCYPYLNNATAKPKDECCNPIKEAVANDLPCLCNLYSDPNLLPSLNVSVSEALRISRECGVPTDLSACKNATSHNSAPPSAGQHGGEGGGADKITSTGATILFLFLVSMALY